MHKRALDLLKRRQSGPADHPRARAPAYAQAELPTMTFAHLWKKDRHSRTCRCRWPRALLPDTHEQVGVGGTASYVLPEARRRDADRRAPQLASISQGKGKTLGPAANLQALGAGRNSVQIRHFAPAEADKQRPPIDAPGGAATSLPCVSARCWVAMGANWPEGPPGRVGSMPSPNARTKNVGKVWPRTLAKNPTPMNYHSALNVVRAGHRQGESGRDSWSTSGAGTARSIYHAPSIVDMYKRDRANGLDVSAPGCDGIGHGLFDVPRAGVSGEQVIAGRRRTARFVGFFGHGIATTICRYDLPVVPVVINEQQRRLPAATKST